MSREKEFCSNIVSHPGNYATERKAKSTYDAIKLIEKASSFVLVTVREGDLVVINSMVMKDLGAIVQGLDRCKEEIEASLIKVIEDQIND